MQTEQIVGLLIAGRKRLDAAIIALQGSEKRRGRPPKAPSAAVSEPVATRLGSLATESKRSASAIYRELETKYAEQQATREVYNDLITAIWQRAAGATTANLPTYSLLEPRTTCWSASTILQQVFASSTRSIILLSFSNGSYER